MNLVARLVVALLWLSTAVVAQDISRTPKCAALCLVEALNTSTCEGKPQKCVCENETMMEELTLCVRDSCTPKEALVAANITSIACDHPIRNTQKLYVDSSIGFLVATSTVVGLRIFQRVYSGVGLQADDYLIIISWLLGIPSTVINVVGLTAHGLGRDAWTLSFDEITNFLRFLYVNEILYFTEVFAVKVSILAFYLRIFPDDLIRKVIWGTIVVSGLFIVIFDFITIFQCTPISFKWMGWNKDIPGHCLSINAITWAIAAASIILDFWMLGIALSQLRQLKLHWKKKIGVALMFSVGMFVTAVSILRLQFLVHFGSSTNPTWDQFATCYWSSIELNVSVCCACMPALRLLLVRMFPRAMGTSKERGRHTPSTSLIRRRREHVPMVSDPRLKIVKSRGWQLEHVGQTTFDDFSGDTELGDRSPVRNETRK